MMPRPYEPLSAEEADIIRYQSLCHVQDEYLAAEVEADLAMGAIADFASQARFHRRADVARFAELTLAGADAESTRRYWRNRYLLEVIALVSAVQASGFDARQVQQEDVRASALLFEEQEEVRRADADTEDEA